MVLSTTSGTPAPCAIAAIASRSQITPSGFDALSTKIALVRFLSAFLNCLGSVGSTKRTCQSNLGKVSPNWVIEPPYSLVEEMISSPGSIRLRKVTNCAAWPLATAHAAVPPSSAAMRSSSTDTVGLVMRE